MEQSERPRCSNQLFEPSSPLGCQRGELQPFDYHFYNNNDNDNDYHHPHGVVGRTSGRVDQKNEIDLVQKVHLDHHIGAEHVLQIHRLYVVPVLP